MYASVYVLYSGSSFANTTFHTNLMQIHEKCSNGHGCNFLRCYYNSIWLLNVKCPPMNPPKTKSKLTSKNDNDISCGRYNLKVLKEKTHKIQMDKIQLDI